MATRALASIDSSRRILFALALGLYLCIQAATPAWAWGRLGHRVISRIAEQNLTPKAKAAIAELLEPGENLADASTWADENRHLECGSILRQRISFSPSSVAAEASLPEDVTWSRHRTSQRAGCASPQRLTLLHLARQLLR
jgi:S1/P1 Nuclease